MKGSFSIDLARVSGIANASLIVLAAIFFLLGNFFSFYFHFATVFFVLLTAVNSYYLFGQREHALLSNFGFMAQIRYLLESVGPEFRQYLFMSDVEEKPFNRTERSEVYRKSKAVDSSASFGSLNPFNGSDFMLRHSMFPVKKADLEEYRLSFSNPYGDDYVINKPILISGMSYGALSAKAIRALSRGAKASGIVMNTGEGGYPKYHMMEGADLIFQIGTAKFGVRDEQGKLCDNRLAELSKKDEIKMIEIKFSQGAKPGKGGMLPKEKITEEISELRGVAMGEDVLSPSAHSECSDLTSTVEYIHHIQKVSKIPVGIKICLGRVDELKELFREMKRTSVFPAYITVDGAEGGTGAAPKAFMDDVGVPLFEALPIVHGLLVELEMREKIRILAAGKLVDPGRQFVALSLGADAIYSARGFMLAIGCIQALQCNANTCPVGITSHDPKMTRGLDIDLKALRVQNYVENLMKDHKELMASMGIKKLSELSARNILFPNNEKFQGAVRGSGNLQ